LDQARKEFDRNRWLQHRQIRLAFSHVLLNQHGLKAAKYIGIKKFPPEETYNKLVKLSKQKVIKVKDAMIELKEAFNFNPNFRKEAKNFYEMGCFRTKRRWLANSYYAIEQIADHVIECSDKAVQAKISAEAHIRKKVGQKLKESFLSKTLSILSDSACLAGTRVFSFASTFIKNVLDNPFETGKGVISGVGQQIVEVFQLLGWENKISNPQRYFPGLSRQDAIIRVAQELQTTRHGLMGRINSFIHLMETNPRLATVEIFATAMEFALLHVLVESGIANYRASRFIKPAVDSMKSGLLKIPHTVRLVDGLQKIRMGRAHEIGLEMVDTPMIIACSELGEVGAFLTESMEKGGIKRGAFRKTLQIIEHNPDIIVGKKTLSDVFKECVRLSKNDQKIYLAKAQLAPHLGIEKTVEYLHMVNKKWPWSFDRFKHVVIGDMSANNGYLLYGGLHTDCGFKYFLKLSGKHISEFTFVDLGNGVIGVHFPESVFVHRRFYENAAVNLANGKKLEGVKTFWPKHFSYADIINAGSELFADASNITRTRPDGSKTFKKRLASGLKIQGRLNSEGKIYSVFPAWEQ
jgi:hypothetical protein